MNSTNPHGGQAIHAIITALRHPVRRTILNTLAEKPQRYSELLEVLDISSSSLSYHLAQMSSLIESKDNTYTLSILGREAINLIQGIQQSDTQNLMNRAVQLENTLAAYIRREYYTNLTYRIATLIAIVLTIHGTLLISILTRGYASSTIPWLYGEIIIWPPWATGIEYYLFHYEAIFLVESIIMTWLLTPLVAALAVRLWYRRTLHYSRRNTRLTRTLTTISFAFPIIGWLLFYSRIPRTLYWDAPHLWSVSWNILATYNLLWHPFLLFLITFLTLWPRLLLAFRRHYTRVTNQELGLNPDTIQKYLDQP